MRITFDRDHDEGGPPPIGRRLFQVGLLVAGLGILLFFVSLLVWDRSSTANQVRHQVAEGWARNQIVSVPKIVVPYTVTSERRSGSGADAETRLVRLTRHFTLSPSTFEMEAVLKPSIRTRALYDVPVYTADMRMGGAFNVAVPDFAQGEDIEIDWGAARMLLAVTDPRGFEGDPEIAAAGIAGEVEPGVPGVETPYGVVSQPIRLDGQPGGTLPFSAQFSLKGFTGFSVAGAAGESRVAIASSWPHPSFISDLPDEQSVSEDGFTASWSATNLSTGGQLVSRGVAAGQERDHRAIFAGVQLIEPVDLYGQLERAVKYGILFIALTFLIVFVFDVTGRRRVPMVAYALSGLGLVLFYVMLLAFAEHIPFPVAYVVAAIMLIALVASYVGRVLRNKTRGLVLAGGLAALYGGLFVLIRLEDIALLVGSLTLFAALAVLMYVTRDIGEPEALEPVAA